jgi:hypothetical protein
MCAAVAVEQGALHVHVKATVLGESSDPGGCGIGYEPQEGVDMTPSSP